MNNRDIVPEFLGVIELMGREDDGFPAIAQEPEGVFHLRGIDGIETTEGFIEHENVGIVEDRGQKLDLLLISFAQRFDLLESVFFNIESFEPLIERSLSIRFRGAIELRKKKQVILNRHSWIKPALFRQIPESLARNLGADDQDDAADDADRATMAEFSGTTDSVLYHQFADGDHRYVLGRFRRTEAPPVGPLRLTDEQRTLARATATIAVDALTMSSAGTDRREVDRA